MKADATLDCIGLMCPMPVANVAMQMKSMAKGQVLEMIADDPGSQRDIAAWARVTGNELMATEEANGHFKYYIRKG